MPDEDEFTGRTRRSGTPPNAVAQTAEIPQHTLDSLLNSAAEGHGVLADQRRDVPFSFWPRLADSMTYARSDLNGGLGGFVAARSEHGVLQLRVQYHVTHQPRERTIVADIFYEGNAPQAGHARVFFIPFTHTDGTAQYLVIAFEAG